MKRLICLSLLVWFTTTSIFAQQTYVPDDNFEQALIDLGLDSGPLDDYVPTANIQNITSLEIYNKNIADLTGIEDFSALEVLNVSYNQLSTIDISQNLNLTELYCSHNQLSTLDLSQNVNLTVLGCSFNQLTQLDVSHNAGLNILYCGFNQISALDISQNLQLTNLACAANALTALDVSVNTNLTSLQCSNNALSQLDVSQNVNLVSLGCADNQLTSLDVSHNTGLVYFTCASNQISSLDLSLNTTLEAVNVSRNLLTQIDISHNTLLTGFYCSGNQISFLELSNNTNLLYLSCGVNQLTHLDVSHNPGLISLSCSGNQLTSLDVSLQSHLEKLFCGTNQLTDLDVSHNTHLEDLLCDHNQLTALDVSNNPSLTALEINDNQIGSLDIDNNGLIEILSCQNNRLSELHIQNGANGLLSGTYSLGGQTYPRMNATGNPGLTCIFVDDATAAAAGTGDYQDWAIDPASHFVETTAECDALDLTYVPDDHFEAYLEAHGMGNGINNDDYVSTSNINTVTTLNIYNQNISDLTGIEDFTALTRLNAHNNNINTLDLSQNTQLQYLYVYNNQLIALDLSHNPALMYLDVGNNHISAIDLSQNTQLISLMISRNQLTDLDLSMLPALTALNCSRNQLTDLNVQNGNNTNFTVFVATNNPDLTCIQVDDAAWSTANWTDIDATAHFSEDCSAVTYSLTVNTTGNGSVTLSPAGGVYNDGDVVSLTATPDTGWEFSGWSGDLTDTTNPATITMDSDKTVTATFTQPAQTYVPDDNFEQALIDLGLDTGTPDDYVPTSNIQGVLTLMLSNKNISDLTGIEDFTALQTLYAFHNNLTSIDLSGNPNLTYLELGYNHLTALDVSQNPALTQLKCSLNQITALDVSNNPDLTNLHCSGNQLTALDVSQNPQLEELYCYTNHITGLNLDNNTHLNKLWCFSNNLTGLHIQNGANGLLSGTYTSGSNTYARFRATSNPDLTCIFVDDATAATAGTGDYQDWDIDTTSHYVETQAECDALGITDLDLKNSLKVYPNPVKNMLHIQSELMDKIDIYIYNLVGQELIHKTINNQQTGIDITELPAANYLIKIVVDNRRVYYNIIKE